MKKILEQALVLPVCFDVHQLVQDESKSNGARSKSYHQHFGSKEIQKVKQGNDVFMTLPGNVQVSASAWHDLPNTLRNNFLFLIRDKQAYGDFFGLQ